MDYFLIKWLENALCFLQSDIVAKPRSATRADYEWVEGRYRTLLELYVSLSEIERVSVHAGDVLSMCKLARDQACSECVGVR